MKDKLYKTNHKKFYYRTKRLAFSCAFLFSCSLAISVPTYINLQNVELQTLNATEKKEEESSKTSSSECVEYSDLTKDTSSLN